MYIYTCIALLFDTGVQMCVASTVIRDMVGIDKFPWVLGLALGAAGLSNLAFIQLLGRFQEERLCYSYLILSSNSKTDRPGYMFFCLKIFINTIW